MRNSDATTCMIAARSTRSGWPGGFRWSAKRSEVTTVSGTGGIVPAVCGHVERLHIRTAERIVRDQIFRDRDELDQFALGRDDVDAGPGVKCFGCPARLVETGGRV